jgi:hypothetical protein
MSEVSTIPSKEASTRKHYEILHYPHIDVVINNGSSKAGLALQIAEAFKSGLENIPDGWEQTGQNIRMARGRIDGVNLFAKPKAHSGPTFYEERENMYERAVRNNYSKKGFRHALRVGQVLNSVLNEVALSPKVKELVASPEAQAIVKERGFGGISFVEPIVGMVDKSTGKRTVVYESIPDVQPLGTDRINVQYGLTSQTIPMFYHRFYTLFEKNGIKPNDLAERQFLVDPNDNLHLIDIEAYYQMSPEEHQEAIEFFAED